MYSVPLTEALERVLSVNGGRGEKYARQLMRAALRKGLKNLTQSAKASLPADPRDAYKAVRMAAYRRMVGGNLNILQRRKATNQRSTYQPVRKLREGQRGGNRMAESARTKQLRSYYGKDRGFVLRFLNSGTGERSTRFHANRGRIGARGWFSNAGARAVGVTAQQFSEDLAELYENLWGDSN